MFPQTEEEILEIAFSNDQQLLEKLKNSEDGIPISTPERKYKKYKLGLLRPDGKSGFPTESGKLEIYSAYLKKHGYEPLPKYSEPLERTIAIL